MRSQRPSETLILFVGRESDLSHMKVLNSKLAVRRVGFMPQRGHLVPLGKEHVVRILHKVRDGMHDRNEQRIRNRLEN